MLLFLIILSALFFILWMGQIIPPTFSGETPKSLIDIGMPVNPVHVLDLSIFLPGIFISALLLKRRNPLGYLFAPSLLIFSMIMAVSIAVLMIMLTIKGFENDIVLSIVFLIIALIGLFIFRGFIKSIEVK